jgi:hypothetical protein
LSNGSLGSYSYTQFFGADIDNVLTTSLNYEKIIDTAYNKDAKGRNGQPIYLTNFNEVWATDSDEDICISSDPNSKGTQAFALQVKHFRYFQQLKLDNWSDRKSLVVSLTQPPVLS